jgi:hypothetical protein
VEFIQSYIFISKHSLLGITLVRKSKVQYSKIAIYWAPLTLGFSILWSVALNLFGLSGWLPALSLAGPILLGTSSSVVLYFLRDHRELEYDDRGYRERRGRKDLAPHQWSEFKECSIVRDSYGRQKVRAYFERDGPYYDIDSSACGIDSYRFRDFVSSRINLRSPEERPPDLVGGLERELQGGRARLLADLSETFRDYQVSGEVFPLLARGGTRSKGFLISRFVAFAIMPNYNVCMYTQWVDGSRAKEKVMRLLRVVETQRDQKDIKWSWLLLLGDESAPESVKRFIDEFGNREVGLSYLNIATGEIRTSPNQLGRSMANQMRLNRLIHDLHQRKYPVY